MSNQRAGLWGPSVRACELCNGTSQCTSGPGGPHGLGCPYTAFGQFQYVRLACAVPKHGRLQRRMSARGRCAASSRADAGHGHARRFLCTVGVMWWTGTTILLGLAYLGRGPPLMTARSRLPWRAGLPPHSAPPTPAAPHQRRAGVPHLCRLLRADAACARVGGGHVQRRAGGHRRACLPGRDRGARSLRACPGLRGETCGMMR